MPLQSAADLQAGILEHFGSHVPPDAENLVAECVKICQLFNVSPSELFYKWEAMTLDFKSGHSSIIRTIDAGSLLGLKTSLQKSVLPKQEKKLGGQAMLAGVMSRGNPGGFMGYGTQRGGLNSGRPTANLVKREVVDRKPFGLYGSGKVKLTHVKPKPYRYMYEKPSERSDVLDDKIDDFAEIVRRHYELADLGDPAAATEEDVVVVGRVVPDAEAPASAKINDSSICLESSRMMGSGVRVPLRFSPSLKIRRGRGTVGLFPGAIVALRGRNGGGGWFSVSEILWIPPMTAPPARITDSGGDSSFTMFITCGPYTPDSDLLFKPWQNLMSIAAKEKPDVILLLGPFIDCTHPQVKTGDVDETPRNLFRSQFEQQLNDLLAVSPNTSILIVPSVQEVLSNHAVFPQPELDASLIPDPRVQFLPNPCKFALNGVSFAATTVDVLFHLRKEEFIKRAEQVEPLPDDGADPMASLCRHLLQQRSMYPIFPVPVDNSQEVNLDVSHSELLDLDEGSEDPSPHVLVVPSRLKYFSRTVDETTAINPSHLSKGTYAHVAFSYTGERSVKDSINVEIKKL